MTIIVMTITLLDLSYTLHDVVIIYNHSTSPTTLPLSWPASIPLYVCGKNDGLSVRLPQPCPMFVQSLHVLALQAVLCTGMLAVNRCPSLYSMMFSRQLTIERARVM